MIAWLGFPRPFGSRWDREFESAFLQQRVCKPSVPWRQSRSVQKAFRTRKQGGDGAISTGLGRSTILPRRKCEALRAIDASIMPTVVSGKTNAATIMIAERGPT
jgi:hypothetical protein